MSAGVAIEKVFEAAAQQGGSCLVGARAEQLIGEWPYPDWNRMGQFVFNVVSLKRSVARLREPNNEAQDKAPILQGQADDQAGQLKVRLTFALVSLRDWIEMHAERS
ncbi:hypothetical protein RZS28_04900 [Methylocapsa polymorpha]|uniref:Uncharacterized protein n=1 Tax=Methylocapsa polymorpha TaxID=3080828 RepID=A0ABZ0HV92_9HYPH|nr:hypothetical protein RZS28_04900 [Methylocapsa sp. RX1]